MSDHPSELQDTGYTGPVGHEKAIHKTHFQMPELHLRKTGRDDGYEWVEISAGHWKCIKKQVKEQ